MNAQEPFFAAIRKAARLGDGFTRLAIDTGNDGWLVTTDGEDTEQSAAERLEKTLVTALIAEELTIRLPRSPVALDFSIDHRWVHAGRLDIVTTPFDQRRWFTWTLLERLELCSDLLPRDPWPQRHEVATAHSVPSWTGRIGHWKGHTRAPNARAAARCLTFDWTFLRTLRRGAPPDPQRLLLPADVTLVPCRS